MGKIIIVGIGILLLGGSIFFLTGEKPEEEEEISSQQPTKSNLPKAEEEKNLVTAPKKLPEKEKKSRTMASVPEEKEEDDSPPITDPPRKLPNRSLMEKDSYDPPEIITEADLEDRPEITFNREDRVLISKIVAVPLDEVKDFPQEDIIVSRGGLAYVERKKLKNKVDYENVTYNPRTKQIGHLTGKVKVKLKKMSDLNQLLSALPGLKVERRFPPLKMVFFSAKDSANIIELFNFLQTSPLVKKAELDLVESSYKVH